MQGCDLVRRRRILRIKTCLATTDAIWNSSSSCYLVSDASKSTIEAHVDLLCQSESESNQYNLKTPEVAYAAECVGNVLGVALIGMGIRAHIDPVNGEQESTES